MFMVKELSQTPIVVVGKYIQKTYNLDMVVSDSFESFLKALEENYIDNPYHNATHAADVMSSMMFFVE
jgi:hypothetical protein